MVGHLLEYHPGVEQAEGDRRRRASSATSTTSTATGSTSASCAPTRTRSGRWARTTSRWCCSLAGEEPSEVQRVRRELHAARDRGRRLLLPALPVRPRRASAPVVARPAQGAPLHGGRARSGWRRSTTWRSSGRSRSTTRASTRTSPRTASTSRARATSTARASRTRSRCGSSAATSSSASRTGASRARAPESGVRVVRVLEALQDSLARDEPCCNRLTARPACCWATASSCPTTRRSARTW